MPENGHVSNDRRLLLVIYRTVLAKQDPANPCLALPATVSFYSRRMLAQCDPHATHSDKLFPIHVQSGNCGPTSCR